MLELAVFSAMLISLGAMASSRFVVAACVIVAGCGLERDWAAWQAVPMTEPSDDSSSSSSSDAPQTGTSTSGIDSSGAGSTQTTGDASTSGGISGEASSAGETTSEATTASTTSTGDVPVCGDGIVDAPDEECDDANLDETDRCASTCKTIRLIFVTSVRLKGNINGLVNADANCKSLAAKAMMADPTSRITNASNFKALLATSTQTVFDRHFPGAGPYQLVNGLRVSDSFTQLFSEPHHNPINVDERSMTQSTGVWTGTTADGQSFPGVNFWNDWTTLQGSASWGDTDYVNGWWLYIDIALGNPTIDCSDNFALYCVEQE